MLTRRPRCTHCHRVLMLGEEWHEASPRVFYCQQHRREAELKGRPDIFELQAAFGARELIDAQAD